MHSGIFAVGHRGLSVEGELTAALFYAGPGAALSHTTAAWRWRLLPDAPAVIHVIGSHHREPVAGVRVHRVRPVDRVFHRRLPVTPVPRTLLDLASSVPFTTLRRALAEAEYLRLVSVEEVGSALGRGRPGSAALRGALERHQPQLARTRSDLEVAFLDLCEEFGIPVPKVNVKICGFLVDALWREQKVVVELDGGPAHSRPVAVERDRRRELALREAGYMVLRYSWWQITDEAGRVAADLHASLQKANQSAQPPSPQRRRVRRLEDR